MDRIQKWLAFCLTAHSGSCKASAELPGGFVPSRLVKVRHAGDVSVISVVHRQDIVHDREADMRYMTLSHCWGSKRPLVLDKRTFSELQNGIPIEKLPKTFQEAVQLTQLLGLHYLWIDALCIFQDSREDWEMEAVRMTEVYSNSYLNLAASTATDGCGGLFSTHENPPLMPLKVEVDLHITIGSNEAGFSFKGPYLVSRHDVFSSFIETAPLYKRAWVFQERILAPRTIHFAEDQMFWECNRTIASELHPITIPGSTASRSNCTRDPASEWTLEIPQDCAVIEFWQRLVNDYCRGRLTISSDKLMAISGIAKEFHLKGNLKPEEYLAGLWAINLNQQLVWYVPRHGRRPQLYRAPSWSWASVDGPVSNDCGFDTAECLLDVEEAYTVPVADPFGAVKTGCFIRVKAHLTWLALKDSLKEGSPEVMELASQGRSKSTRARCVINWDDDSAASLEKLTASRFGPRLIILMACHWFIRESTQERGLKGLVLIGSLYKKGLYMRVGYFEGVYETERERNLLFYSFEATRLDPLFYEAYDAGTNKYTIKIL